jgi:sulfur carrier protein ThiS
MLEGRKLMPSPLDKSNEEKNFGEFRRKVKSAEVLSASMEHLLLSLGFTGRVSVVMQNGRVLKSGYEEGYFHQGSGGRADEESVHKL